MSTRTRVLIALGIVAAVTLGLTGCQAIAEQATKKAVEGATGVKVDSNSKTVTMTGKDGKQVTLSNEEGKLPEGLPTDFPNYSGTVKTSANAETADGSTFTYTISTPDSAKQVLDFYTTKLKAADWKIQSSASSTSNGETGGAVLANKTETSDVMVSISQKSGQDTEIGVVLSVKTKK